MRRSLTLPLLASAILGVLAPATAFGQADSNRTTFLLSRAFDGGLPNGVVWSRHPAYRAHCGSLR